MHEVAHLEQDWWLPSKVITGIDWVDPYDVTFAFGGQARAALAGVTVPDNQQVTMDWRVTDRYGHQFETVLATDVRPFLSLPDVAVLESSRGCWGPRCQTSSSRCCGSPTAPRRVQRADAQTLATATVDSTTPTSAKPSETASVYLKP